MICANRASIVCLDKSVDPNESLAQCPSAPCAHRQQRSQQAKANAITIATANGSGGPGPKSHRAVTPQTPSAIGPTQSTKTSRSTTPKKLKSFRAATVRQTPANPNLNPNPDPNQTQTTPSTPTPSGFAKLFGRGPAGKRHHKQTASTDMPPEVFAAAVAAGDRRPRNATTAGTGDENGQILLMNYKRSGADRLERTAPCPSGRDAAFSKSAPQSRKMSADVKGLIEAFSEHLGAEDSSRGSEHDDASMDDGNERGPVESSTPAGTLTKQKSLDRGTDDAADMRLPMRMPRSATGYSREERLKQTTLLKFKFLNEFDALPADSDLPGAMPLDPSAFQTTNLYGTMSRSTRQFLRNSLEGSPPQAQAQLQPNHNVSHSRSGSDVPPQPQVRRGSAVDSNQCDEDSADALRAMSGSVCIPFGRLDDIVLPASPSKKAASASQSKRTSSLEPDAQRDLTPLSPMRTNTSTRIAPVNFHAEVYNTALALQRLKTPIDMSAALHSSKPSAAMSIPKPPPPLPFTSRNFPSVSSLFSNTALPQDSYSTLSAADPSTRSRLNALSTPRRLLPSAPKLSQNDPSMAFATKARGQYERLVLHGPHVRSSGTGVGAEAASPTTPRDPSDSVDLTDGRSANTGASNPSKKPHCDAPPDQQSAAGNQSQKTPTPLRNDFIAISYHA